MAATYTYRSLDAGHLRLLTLQSPSSDAEILEFNLAHHAESSPPQYHALSYSWDGQSPSVPVRCDGESLLITQTLHAFLLVLQQKKLLGPFWVDAISIRQDDAAEKAAQVRVLHRYFSNAAGVYAWLGPSTPALDEFMDHFPSTVEAMTATPSSGLGRLPDHVQLGGSNGGLEEIVRHFPSREDRIAEQKPFLACAELLSHGWFARLWILQEAILNEDVRMFCGSRSFQLEKLCLFVQLNRNRIPATESHATLFVYGLERLKQDWRRNDGLSLATLTSFSFHREVRLSVDRVYGVLGIMDSLTRGSIKVDYSDEAVREPWRVFINAGHAMLWSSTAMICLQTACARRRAADSNVPSWCPDFANAVPSCAPLSQCWQYGSADVKRRRQGQEVIVLDPSMGQAELPDPWLACSADKRKILMHALVIGTVDVHDSVLPLREQYSTDLDYLHDVHRWLTDWISFCSGTSPDVQATKPIVSNIGLVSNAVMEISARLGRLMGLLPSDSQTSRATSADRIKQYRTEAAVRCLVGNRPLRVGLNAGKETANEQSNYDFHLPVEDLTWRLKNTLEVARKLGDATDLYGFNDFCTREDYIEIMTQEDVRQGLEYLQCIEYFMGDRKPFKIYNEDRSDFKIGVGPNGMKTGELAVIIPNGQVPFILRRLNETEHTYSLVGEAYVEGLMHAEVFQLEEPLPELDVWIE